MALVHYRNSKGGKTACGELWQLVTSDNDWRNVTCQPCLGTSEGVRYSKKHGIVEAKPIKKK